MKEAAVLWAGLVLVSCATSPARGKDMPFDLVQGKIVQLWGVSAIQTEARSVIAGFATRGRTPNGPVNEHLHVEAIDASGRVLATKEVPWNGILSVRSKKSVSFRTEFAAGQSATLARVRLDVVAGPLHHPDRAR